MAGLDPAIHVLPPHPRRRGCPGHVWMAPGLQGFFCVLGTGGQLRSCVPACCRGARPQALMGPVWDRGLIKPAGSNCPITRDRLPSICRLTDTAITLFHPRKPCGPTGTGQVIGSCRRGMPYLVDVSLFGREGPFLRPGLGSLRRRAQPRSRIAAGDRRRRRRSLTAASKAPGLKVRQDLCSMLE